MIKRITALLLTVLILLLQTAAVLAEENPAEQGAHSAFTENAELLTSLGIYSGQTDNPEGTVTRAQFAEAVAELFGWNNIQFDQSAPLPFVDVKSGSVNLNSIKLMITLGLMSGVNAVEFCPDDYITYAQAVKVLVSALGYAPFAEVKGGWPGGYMSVGRGLKLLLDNVGANEPISQDMLVSLFVGAIKAEALELKTLGDKVVYSKKGERTLLSVYHNIYQSRGVLSDNGISALTGASQAGEGNVLISGVTYMNGYMPIRSLLGYSIEFYYRDEAGLLTALYARPDKRTDTLVIAAENLEVSSAEWSKTSIVYEDGGVSRKASVSTYADFIYNGGADPNFTSEDFKIRSGQLTLADTDWDGVYDIVLAEEYIDVFVSGVSEAQEMIYSQYAESVNYGDYKTYSFTDAEGADIEPKAISAGQILSVYASRNKECVKMILGTEKAEVTVDALEEGRDGLILTSGETGYTLSVSLLDAMKSEKSLLKKPELSTRYQAYFNYKGEIAMLEEIVPAYEYAYALGVQRGKGINSDVGQLKLYLSTNDCVTVNTADKVLLNNVSQKGAEVVNIADFYDDGVFEPQLIKMKRNSKGLLTELETVRRLSTAANGFETDSFAMNQSGVYEIYNYGKMPNINYKYGYDENTKIFLINKGASEKLSTTDEKDITVVSGSELSAHYIRRPNTIIYDADEALVAGAVVMSRSSYSSTNLAWVESCKQILDEFGEKRLQVNAYWKGNLWTFRENGQDVFAKAIEYYHKSFDKEYADMSDAEKAGVLARDQYLQPGDVLSVTFDGNNEISYAELQASPMRELGKAGYGKLDLSTVDTATNLIRGNLIVKTDKRIGVLAAATGEYAAVSMPSSAVNAMILNANTGKLTKASITDLPTNGHWTEYGAAVITDTDVSFVICSNRGTLSEILMVRQ